MPQHTKHSVKSQLINVLDPEEVVNARRIGNRAVRLEDFYGIKLPIKIVKRPEWM